MQPTAWVRHKARLHAGLQNVFYLSERLLPPVVGVGANYLLRCAPLRIVQLFLRYLLLNCLALAVGHLGVVYGEN